MNVLKQNQTKHSLPLSGVCLRRKAVYHQHISRQQQAKAPDIAIILLGCSYMKSKQTNKFTNKQCDWVPYPPSWASGIPLAAGLAGFSVKISYALAPKRKQMIKRTFSTELLRFSLINLEITHTFKTKPNQTPQVSNRAGGFSPRAVFHICFVSWKCRLKGKF